MDFYPSNLAQKRIKELQEQAEFLAIDIPESGIALDVLSLGSAISHFHGEAWNTYPDDGTWSVCLFDSDGNDSQYFYCETEPEVRADALIHLLKMKIRERELD